jgi:hypothetical protein
LYYQESDKLIYTVVEGIREEMVDGAPTEIKIWMFDMDYAVNEQGAFVREAGKYVTYNPDDPFIQDPNDPSKRVRVYKSKTAPVTPQTSTFYQTEAGDSYRWNGSDLIPTTEVPPKESSPRRRGLENKGFSFFYTDPARMEANPVPVSGDTDTNYTGYVDGSKWYVNAYAVSVGQGIDFSLSYSRIVELGYIIISQSGI